MNWTCLDLAIQQNFWPKIWKKFLSSNFSNDTSTKIASRVCGHLWKSLSILQGTHLLLLTLRAENYIWYLAVGWPIVKEGSYLNVWWCLLVPGLEVWEKGRKSKWQEIKRSMEKKRKESNLDWLGNREWRRKWDNWYNEQAAEWHRGPVWKRLKTEMCSPEGIARPPRETSLECWHISSACVCVAPWAMSFYISVFIEGICAI